MVKIDIPKIYKPLFTLKKRHKVFYGGRGSGKSHNIARSLLVIGIQKTTRILCAREFQNSIAESVHRLLSDLIKEYNLEFFYKITRNEIVGVNGTLFIFRGLHFDPAGVKSLEGVDIVWLEEAEKISNESLDFLIPTIRKPESELWYTFNPYKQADPVYDRFITKQRDDTFIQKVNWVDNPWFPDVLKSELEFDKINNIDKYNWVWLGMPLGISDALVFKGKFVCEDFETPENVEFYHGVDWGFSQDPTTAIRCFIKDSNLYIDRESYGVQIEINNLPTLFENIETLKTWASYADSARPETISYLKNHGFPKMRGVDKWKGSIEDGIEYMRTFKKIIIHPSCQKTFEEFNLYSYKKDSLTNEITPIIIDKNNHCIDAIRYALGKLIQGRRRGTQGAWRQGIGI